MVCISVLSWRQSVIITLPSESRVQKPCNFWPFYSLLPSNSFYSVCHFLVFLCSCNSSCHTWKTVWWTLLLYTCSLVWLFFFSHASARTSACDFLPISLKLKQKRTVSAECEVSSEAKCKRDPKRFPPVILPLKGAPNLPFSQMCYNSISHWVVFAWGESSLKNSLLLKGYWTSVIKTSSLWPGKVQGGVSGTWIS